MMSNIGMGTTSASTGFLYDAGGDVPVCCTPEYLAAYGVGLDSTYGDGIVEGVLREDQAESAFMGMFPDQYDAVQGIGRDLGGLTDDIKEFALSLPEGINLFDLTKALSTSNVDRNNDNAEEQAINNLNIPGGGTQEEKNAEKERLLGELQLIVDQTDSLIASNPELENMLGNFFGEDTLDEEGTIGHMMVSTVLLGYDVENGDNGGDGANGRNDITMDKEDLEKLEAGEQPRVSLGEIVQWSLETNAYMGMYNEIGAGQSLAEFTQNMFTQVSEGTLPPEGIGPYSPEQIQVLVSVMMNNHSNLMSTTGNFSESGKNGAHEYLNNVGGGNRAFNMLHVGNMGTTGEGDLNDDENGNANATGNANNENLNEVVRERTENGAGTIFYAGDNGAGANGGFDDLTDDDDYIEGYQTTSMGSSSIVDDMTSIVLDDSLQSELLADLTSMGAADPDGQFPGAMIEIDGQEVQVSIENSEDFENEGYDVVVISLTDPVTGAMVGSMTATEGQDISGAPKLVAFGDKNGDGIVDQVGDDGLSLENFDADGVSVLEYATKGVDDDDLAEDGKVLVGNVIMDDTMTSQGLAMNESEDATSGEWLHNFEDGMVGDSIFSGVGLGGPDEANALADPITGFPSRISGWDNTEVSTQFTEDQMMEDQMMEDQMMEDQMGFGPAGYGMTGMMNETERQAILNNLMTYNGFGPTGPTGPTGMTGMTDMTPEVQGDLIATTLGFMDNGDGSYTDPTSGSLYYFDPTTQTLVVA